MNGGATTEANPTGTPPFEGSVLRVDFRVAGLPIAQGSKVRTPYGVRESARGLAAWRNAVADKAREAMNGREPFVGRPLRLAAIFYLPRPRDHFGTGANAGKLKPNAARWHTGKRDDLDKLLRAVGDALTGVVVHDDGLFCVIAASKVYGTPIGVEIDVAEVTW